MKGLANAVAIVCIGVSLALGVARLGGGSLPSPTPGPGPTFEPSLNEKTAVDDVRLACHGKPERAAQLAAFADTLADYLEANEDIKAASQVRALIVTSSDLLFRTKDTDLTEAVNKGVEQIAGLSGTMDRSKVTRAFRSVAWAARNPKRD